MEDASTKKSYDLPTYTLMKNDFIRRILREAGVKEPCVRYAVHYNELEYIGEMDRESVYVVFYEGPDIVGYSKICQRSRKVEQFKVENTHFAEYFERKVKKITEKTHF
jgi:hypothetical protein